MIKVTVNDCFYEIKNGANIKQGIIDGGYPITRIETLSNGVFNRDKVGYAGITDIDKYSEYILDDDDLLMSHINSVQYLGRTVIYKRKDDENIIHGMNLLRLRPRKDLVYPKYISYLFSGHKFKESISRITKKSVNQASFSVSDLKKIVIYLPDIDEQIAISEKLDQIEKIIAEKRLELKLLDNLINSLFVEMFGDPVENRKGWKKFKLIDICDKLTDGTHFSPESFPKGEFMYITAKNIKIEGFDLSNVTFVNADVHNEIYARCNPEYGDILYIKDGATTGVAMVNTLREPFTLLSSVALLKQKRNVILGPYLCAVLNNQHMYDSIRSNMGGAAITRLTIAKLNEISIPVAPMSLQEQFVAFVEEVDKLKLEVNKNLKKIKLLKVALMQQYFNK